MKGKLVRDPGGPDRAPGCWLIEPRIGGVDTYRPGLIVLDDQPEPLTAWVRIFALDDVTVLQPMPGEQQLPPGWSGTLLLPPAGRRLLAPAALVSAVSSSGVDLSDLHPDLRRHLASYVAEARPGPIREARVLAALKTIARLNGTHRNSR